MKMTNLVFSSSLCVAQKKDTINEQMGKIWGQHCEKGRGMR